jgi:O-succinylbenzoic acid--CoA ligase
MGKAATPPAFLVTEIPAGRAGADLLATRVAAAMAGGPAVALVPGYGPNRLRVDLLQRLAAAQRRLEAGGSDHAAGAVTSATAVILPTSGSTGAPRLVVLSRRALAAAADARDAALGGPAAWFVALPAVTAAALIATTRAVLSGSALGAWSGLGGLIRFDASAVAAELNGFLTQSSALGQPARISLVATQLERICSDPAAAAGLAEFDRVLVGGGPISQSTMQQAADASIRITTTYGLTETCGGCVYNGLPTPGVTVAVGEGSEILLGGDCLASGYLDSPMPTTDQGLLRTGDRGRVGADGTLRVLGRFDEVVTVRGVNVDLAAVSRIVAEVPGVQESVVVAVADADGGHRVQAHVTGTATAAEIRQAVAEALGPAAVPRVLASGLLPRLPGGKVDVQRLQKGSR